MTPQPTDADREFVDLLCDRGWLETTRAKLTQLLVDWREESLAKRIAEVRASAYAQGRADERERIAAGLAEQSRDLHRSDAPGRGFTAATLEGIALTLRAAQEGASDGPA